MSKVAYNVVDLELGSLLPNGRIVISYDFSELEHDGGADNDIGVVLTMQPENMQPYVTWEFYRGDLQSTSNGHYHSTLDGALADFNKRHEALGLGE